jgi:hypothetical protein
VTALCGEEASAVWFAGLAAADVALIAAHSPLPGRCAAS